MKTFILAAGFLFLTTQAEAVPCKTLPHACRINTATQKIRYSTVFCGDKNVDLGKPSKIIALYNFDFINIDSKVVRLKVKDIADYDHPSKDQVLKLDSLSFY